MNPFDAHFSLCGQASGLLKNLAVSQNPAWLGIEKKLGHAARLQPVRVGVDDRCYVDGIAFNGNLPRLRQRWTPSFAWLGKGPAVFRHFLIRQLPKDRARQDPLNEEIFFENHLFSGIGTQRL